MSHYKLVNTTKHAGVKMGKHKNGFFVSVATGSTMGPGQHTVVENITPGILGMQQKGYIKIETIDDIKIEIEKEIEKMEKENTRKRRLLETKLKKLTADGSKKKENEIKEEIKEIEGNNEESIITHSLDKDALKANFKANNNDTEAIVTSGETGEDPMSDVEEANFTDGEPNFVVQAGKKGKGRKNK